MRRSGASSRGDSLSLQGSLTLQGSLSLALSLCVWIIFVHNVCFGVELPSVAWEWHAPHMESLDQLSR
jgi:hypothetical protein